MRLRELMEAPQSLEIFCDMDGVLVDFALGVEKAYYKQTGERVAFSSISTGEMWKTVNRAGEGWWINLPWMSDGKRLWSSIKKYKPTILTAPSTQKICAPEKEEWVARNLGPGFKFICDPDKWKYATQYGILIDDTPEKIISWEEHNGIGILHTDTVTTIKKLKKMGFK